MNISTQDWTKACSTHEPGFADMRPGALVHSSWGPQPRI